VAAISIDVMKNYSATTVAAQGASNVMRVNAHVIRLPSVITNDLWQDDESDKYRGQLDRFI
jgi:hypothetical protein